MKKIYIVGLLLASAFLSCKKDVDKLPSLSSFTVVNAAIGITSAKAYAGPNPVAWSDLTTANSVSFSNTVQMGALAGFNNVMAVSGTDTNLVLFQSPKTENFKVAGFNTLFLYGNVGAYKGILINNDNITRQPDSVIGIRFINLSPNSTPINITLGTAPTINEVSNLAYENITDFKAYPAGDNVNSIVFQVRNASGLLLSTYTLQKSPVSPYTTVGIPYARFNNITLVVKGLQGTTSGTNAFGVFPVPHY